jgi:hypothetical protein
VCCLRIINGTYPLPAPQGVIGNLTSASSLSSLWPSHFLILTLRGQTFPFSLFRLSTRFVPTVVRGVKGHPPALSVLLVAIRSLFRLWAALRSISHGTLLAIAAHRPQGLPCACLPVCRMIA